jgi:hypothetical protein
MSRRTSLVLNAIVMFGIGLLAGWQFVEPSLADGLGPDDVIDFVFGAFYGLVIPLAFIGEWVVAWAKGDQKTMEALEHTAPIVTVVLMGISLRP